MTAVQFRIAPTADLAAAGLPRLRGFLDAAFDGRFGDENWSHALGGVHVLATVDGEPVGHASVVGRQLIVGELTLRTGYVEAVATADPWRCRGIAATVMTEVERLVTGGFELGALASSRPAIGFYERRGWRRWTGPIAALTPAGVVETPDDRVFVLRTPLTPPEVDPAVSRLVCDWRRGHPW